MLITSWPPLSPQVPFPHLKLHRYIEAINASRKCCVCLYTLSTSAFPSGKLTAACNHPAAACTSCLTDLFTDCFAKNVASFEAPKCPECAETLSVTDVQRIGGRSLASAYNERLTLSLLRADPDFRECLNPDCSAGMGRGQLHEGGEEAPIVTCKYCSAKSCFAHKLPWHEGQTCEEFDEANAEYRAAREKENQLSTKYMEKKYKRCPKCKAFIEKFHGCNHMTCRACEHEFCWLCMAPYRGRLGIMDFGNRGHYVGCRFHG
ncbi:hypothetical protein FN846DRAFT_892938 [Sphaerosporella brunnea]|uniref:RBR-type E3 ubiquitin transferase n=1 Tax=Sphaerosporella brunnea TaxID=1250544 RepID=A0A5J5EPX5_9PEZI|nr:hypothetical protein FN846DRAFT_783093 [Sphaerosporella brunnea]KAA8897792.1 hypothetical protein FN846DRAFT_892938 [Sphaerosporella brunnea]